ncbi:hypothetical protein C3L33_03645, partial [Rhododendron williamsianum]
MKGTSKVIMGATLVMLAILATVLGLVLVLLAELYCSMLLRRRRKPTPSTAAATASNTPANDSSPLLPTQSKTKFCLPNLLEPSMHTEYSMLQEAFCTPPLSTAKNTRRWTMGAGEAGWIPHSRRRTRRLRGWETTGFPAKDLPGVVQSRFVGCGKHAAVVPMKKLPEEGCSVSLKDARSLATSSDSNSNSDSSSASPCTSPSW